VTATVTNINEKRRTAVAFRSTPDESKLHVNAILSAIGAASTDAGRPILCNVKITLSKEAGQMKLVATNSYRANRMRINTINPIEDDAEFMVNVKELKAALPKPSEFKARGSDYFVLTWFPGERELDAGQLGLTWGNNQRILRAEPCATGSSFGQYPDVEALFGSHEKETSSGQHTDDPVGWHPEFLADICNECKRLDKENPVRMDLGITPLKPAIFTFNVPTVSYECLLMPVRLT